MKKLPLIFLISFALLAGNNIASAKGFDFIDSYSAKLHAEGINMPNDKLDSINKELAFVEQKELSLKELKSFLEELDVLDVMDEKEEYHYLTEQLLNVAKDFEGVRYKFGGMSRKGMDCSGFVLTAFKAFDITLPRTSLSMANVGKKIKSSEALKGDLIFFKGRKGSRIGHVGIITEVNEDEIKFIHSSTSRGVVVSSLKEPYYKRKFVQINRVYER